MKKLLCIVFVVSLLLLVACKTPKLERISSSEPVAAADEATPSSRQAKETSESTATPTPGEDAIGFQQLNGGWSYLAEDKNSFVQIIFSSQTTFIYAYGAHAGGGEAATGTYAIDDNTITFNFTAIVGGDAKERNTECAISLQDDQLTLKFLSGDEIDKFLAKPGDELVLTSGTIV